MPEVMLEHRHWAPPHRWPLWKWPIKPSSQTTLDLFTRRNLKPTPKPKRNTLIQALPDLRPLEIAVRDRLYTRCERGQNWGHNSIFSGCNYRPRAQSKCSLAIRIVFRYRRLGCFIGSTVERTPSESDPESMSGRANWHNMPMFVCTGLASTGDNYGDPKCSAHSSPGTGYS